MREVSREEMEQVKAVRKTMTHIARDEIRKFLESGYRMAEMDAFEYSPEYAVLQYRSAVKRWYRDEKRRDKVIILYRKRKIYAERMDYRDGRKEEDRS